MTARLPLARLRVGLLVALVVLAVVVTGGAFLRSLNRLTLPGSAALTATPGASAVTGLALELTPGCYVPDGLAHTCSSQVTMELVGASTGAGYAQLPAGLGYTFSPASFVVASQAPTSIELAIDVPAGLAPGTYALTAIARLPDGSYVRATVPLQVSESASGFALEVETSALALNASGYATTHVHVVREPGFGDEVALDLFSDGNILEHMDYAFSLADEDPDDQVLVIQGVELTPGTYPMFVRGRAGALSRLAAITLNVP